MHAGVFFAAVYGGYFGAGLGIMLLAALGAFLPDDMQRLNALKGLLSLRHLGRRGRLLRALRAGRSGRPPR